MRLAFVTVGDTTRRTGGYRYHARLFPRLEAAGVGVRQVVAGPADIAGQAAAAPSLGAMVAAEQPDVVAVDALARIAAAPWIPAWRSRHPVVALVHELPANLEGLEGVAQAALLDADLLVAVSPHVRSLLAARGVPGGRLRVVPPGYDHHCADHTRRIPPAIVTVLCVAQWIPSKGITTLLRAWTAHPRPDARLILVGETTADPAYTAEVGAALAGADGVTALGAVDEDVLGARYAAADLFALPSLAEGYGIVYAEALACGLPVLACAVGPVPALVGDAGVLVPPGDEGALTSALDRLLADAGLRRRLAERATRRARELPTWDDTAAGFLRALEEVRP